MKLWVGFLLMIMIMGCEQGSEVVGPQEFCAASATVLPEVNIFSNIRDGESCEYFNRRVPTLFCSFSSINLSSTTTEADVYTNDILEGVFSGDNIAINETNIYVLEQDKIKIYSQETLSQLASIYLNGAANRLYLTQNKLVALSSHRIEVFNLSNQRVLEKDFVGQIQASLKEENLFIHETRVQPFLDDDSFCQKIKYISDSNSSSLTITTELNLETLSFESEEIYSGESFPYIDIENEYLIFNYFYNAKSVVLAGNRENQFTELSGTIPSELFLKEIDNHLHVFTNESRGSNYFELSEEFEEISAIKELAPGESMKAARFGENFSYLMTFLQTDPLYIFDRRGVEGPQLVGELVFPGEPLYLREITESFLISVGRDSHSKLELSLFDVSNPTTPLRTRVLGLDDSVFEWTFDYKNILFYKKRVLVKGSSKVFLISFENEDIILEQTFSKHEDDRFIFRDNDLFHLNQGTWEKIVLDD